MIKVIDFMCVNILSLLYAVKAGILVEVGTSHF